MRFEMTEYLLIFFMSRLSHIEKDDGLAVTGEDFKHLTLLVDKRDGGLPWRHMMDRSTHDMSYQAWIREPEVLFGDFRFFFLVLTMSCSSFSRYTPTVEY